MITRSEQQTEIINFWQTDIIKFVVEPKERLLIKRDRPILNRNISSAKLFLFDNSYLLNRFFIQYYCYIIV